MQTWQNLLGMAMGFFLKSLFIVLNAKCILNVCIHTFVGTYNNLLYCRRNMLVRDELRFLKLL